MQEQRDDTNRAKRIAYFISPHGFGHAARAAAVMQAIADIDASVGFEIFTTVPSWFFQDSVPASFTCHTLLTDIGLVQKTAFQVDLNKTIDSLNDFLPFSASLISEISATVTKTNCVLVICDISPMGISIANEAGIPSVLVENFTWDWIYEQYASADHRFSRHIEYFRSLFQAVNYHIKTKPVCCRGSADLTTPPATDSTKATGTDDVLAVTDAETVRPTVRSEALSGRTTTDDRRPDADIDPEHKVDVNPDRTSTKACNTRRLDAKGRGGIRTHDGLRQRICNPSP